MENKLQSLGSITPYRALVDTSSVVAHDLCAQLHVLQFCLDELGEHVGTDGKEFLDRMEVSTQYISNLVNSFRKQLKISLSELEPEYLDKILFASLELVKNHFFIVIERLELSFDGPLENLLIKHDARQLMLMIFALYAVFIEVFREEDVRDNKKMRITFLAKNDNPRFSRLILKVTNTKVNEQKFEEILSTAAPEKGKIRKFVGLTLVKEYREENPDRFSFMGSRGEALIELCLPLQV